ncbi:MAG: hypothetical protein AAFO69_15815 [Bacteroidota bacterium]
MKSIVTTVFFLAVFLATPLLAQPPGGRGPGGGPGGRPGGSPSEMIKREKQALYSKVKDLTPDQKLLIDGIYEEFEVTLTEKMEELRESGNREGRREAMEALRAEKDLLMADVLNEEQFKLYQSLARTRRERRTEPESDS